MELSLFDDKEIEIGGANFSTCGAHRFFLWRFWDKKLPLVMFIGLNPSIASGSKDDPTIRRVRTISKNLGYGGFYMMNLFSFVTPYPEQLQMGTDHAQNNLYLRSIASQCKDIIFAWGNFKQAEDRAKYVINAFPDALALQINKNGSPKHPLYCKSDIKPVKFRKLPDQFDSDPLPLDGSDEMDFFKMINNSNRDARKFRF